VGANYDEGALFAPQNINTDKDFRAYISPYSDDPSVLDTLEILYPDIPAIGIPAALTMRPGTWPGLQFKRASSVVSDHDIHAPRRLMSETWAANNLTSYSYHFNVQPNGIPDFLGACHFMEVAFALGNIEGVGYVQMGMADPFANVPASYKGVAQLMSSLWASFIHGLDPNGALAEGMTNRR
jgi:carboxylesterase type B